MPHPNAREQVVATLPDGSQLLVERWILADDQIDVSWRATSNTRDVWTPLALCGGSYTVGIVE